MNATLVQMSSPISSEPRSSVETHGGDTPSDANLDEKLSRYRQLLSRRSSHSSIPHQEISLFISEAVQSTNPSTVLSACHIYLNLLETVSVSYDDVAFSSCLHHVCRLLKASVSAPCPKKCSKKTTLCVLGSHIPLKHYISYWQRTADLLDSGIPDVENHSGTSHLINAFIKLLHHSPHEQLLELSVRSISQICRSRQFSNRVISSIYKELFSVMISNISTSNRDAIVDVILETTQAQPEMASDEHSVEKENDRPSSPNLSESTDASNKPDPNSNSRLFLSLFRLCCLHVADKADERTSLCYILERVFSSLPPAYQQSYISVVVKFGSHANASVRMLSVDLSGRLIVNSESSSASILTIFDMLVSRCNDKVGSVRAKAISSVSAIVKSARVQFSYHSNLNSLHSSVKAITNKLQDPKSTVRKVAVEYLSLICMLLEVTTGSHEHPIERSEYPLSSPIDLACQISLRCSDNVASVRLSACIQLQRIICVFLISTDQRKLQTVSICFESVLSLVNDNDSRCRDAALQATHGFLFRQLSLSASDLSTYNADNFDQQKEEVSHQFLAKLGCNDAGFNRKVEKAIHFLSKDGRITKNDIAFVSGLVETSARQATETELMRKGAWIVLSTITATGMTFPMATSVRNDVISGVGVNNNPQALKAMSSVVSQLSTDETRQLENTLIQQLFHSECNDGELVDAAAELLSKINEDSGAYLLGCCEENVSEGKNLPESAIIHVLLWVSSICANFKLLKAPSETLLTFIQAMTSNEQTLPRIRALALVALGKLCLCEALGSNKAARFSIGEMLTRRFVPVLVHELDNATSSATRNNAVVILCDLCRQYTSIVEPFTSRIAGLLSDPSPFVRNQVLSSLVSLLQEDYLKVRPGLLLHQIVRCLLDKSSDVRATAEYTLGHVVPQKNKCLLSVFFVEVMFVLNECGSSSVFNHYKTALQASESFAGKEHSKSRDVAYTIFLKAMPLEQRLRIPGRFRSDILEQILEDKMDIGLPAVIQVLEDCFRLLVCDKLYLFAKKCVGQSSSTVEEGTEAQGSGPNSIFRNIHLIELREYTIPILLQLRTYLQNKRSPLLGTLMQCLCGLLHPHKNHLHQFVTDTTIRKEIEHEWDSKATRGDAKSRTENSDHVENETNNDTMDDR